MDGVLIDSMPWHADAWKMALAGAGISITKQDIYEIEGSNHDGVIRLMFEKAGMTARPQDYEELSRKKREIFRNTGRPRPFDQLTKCLDLLKNKYDLAVVSGSDRTEVTRILDRFYPGIFDAVVTGEDVEEGKPAPEPYLTCLEMLHVQKDECIVIENSPLGVESAKRAGLFVIAVSTYVKSHRLKKADVVLENHTELLEYLAKL